MEPLIHFVVPFAASMLAGVRWRRAFAVSLVALLPDVDALFHVHRSLTHSLVVLSLAGLLLGLLAFRVGAHLVVVLGFLSAASHVLLDLFAGYTPIFWPLVGQSMWIQAELAAHVASYPTLTLALNVAMKPTVFDAFQSLDAPLFTGEGVVITMMLALPILVKAVREKRAKSLIVQGP